MYQGIEFVVPIFALYMINIIKTYIYIIYIAKKNPFIKDIFKQILYLCQILNNENVFSSLLVCMPSIKVILSPEIFHNNHLKLFKPTHTHTHRNMDLIVYIMLLYINKVRCVYIWNLGFCITVFFWKYRLIYQKYIFNAQRHITVHFLVCMCSI